ncbi:hypothetical protein [Immundisolibacter sp.]|uniref:hypothetical protein n=1 Tax=Immundisolibacter sp. TaxID=1934948 RepID=UPI003F8498A2
MSKTESAYNLGREFAGYLNAHPEEAQNWSHLQRGDDLPVEDYRTLRDEFCGEDGVTTEIEQAYRDGFNAVFVPLSDRE